MENEQESSQKPEQIGLNPVSQIIRKTLRDLIYMALGALLLFIFGGPLREETVQIIFIVIAALIVFLITIFIGKRVTHNYLTKKLNYDLKANQESLVELGLDLLNPSKREKAWKKLEHHGKDLILIALSYFSSIRMLGFTITLAGALVGIGTLFVTNLQAQLLEAQNTQFDRQNTFIAFEQTTRFKEILFQNPLNIDSVAIADYQSALPDSIWLWPKPKSSVVSQIVTLAQKEEDIVKTALEPLLLDEASSVSAGALLALFLIKSIPDNASVNLSKANLTQLELSEISLSNANLSKADLTNAVLLGAELPSSNFSQAQLENTDFRGATLWQANLTQANLTRTRLNNAVLYGSILNGAVLNEVILEDADLAEASLINTQGLTITQLCTASNLRDIKPDSLLTVVQNNCPEKAN